jgi:hypothetical protein
MTEGAPPPVELVLDPHVAIALIMLVLAIAILAIMTTIPIDGKDRR